MPNKSLSEIIAASFPSEEEWRRIVVQNYWSAKKNKTCLSYWYSKIKSALPEIKMPKTVIIFSNPHDRLCLLDGKKSRHLEDVVKRLGDAADNLGYPVFMKDSVFSGKHDWNKTCFIERREDILEHLYNIVEFAAMVDVEYACFVCVREFIQTTPAFYAFFGKMPVTKERRYFVKDGKVYFHHPYWTPSAIEQPSCDNWEELLEVINKETQEEVSLLTALTEKVGTLLGDAWSVDWLCDKNGEWWLTDMAEAHKSFMWEDYKTEVV